MARSARQQPPKPHGEVTFGCARCRVEGKVYTFRAAPARTEDDPDATHHPWRYFAPCPSCGAECEQAAWERALFKAWANATGPKTPEGMAATAENLKGHPTAEEARRTRFNAMKHGLNARVATYFPAKPDGYAFCASCEIDREWCAEQPACVKRAETFLMHHAAFDQRKPEYLKDIYADMQAAVTSVVQMILQTIIADGVKITAPVWFSDKDGGFHLAEVTNEETGEVKPILEITSHPLIKSLAEIMKAANLSLADMGMTVKIADAEEEVPGQLTQAPKEAVSDFERRAIAQLESMREVVERAKLRTDQDPVLLEYNKEAGAYEAARPGAGKP